MPSTQFRHPGLEPPTVRVIFSNLYLTVIPRLDPLLSSLDFLQASICQQGSGIAARSGLLRLHYENCLSYRGSTAVSSLNGRSFRALDPAGPTHRIKSRGDNNNGKRVFNRTAVGSTAGSIAKTAIYCGLRRKNSKERGEGARGIGRTSSPASSFSGTPRPGCRARARRPPRNTTVIPTSSRISTRAEN